MPEASGQPHLKFKLAKEDQRSSAPATIGVDTAHSGSGRQSFPDVLRGIAILLVILTHVGQWSPPGSLLSSTYGFGQLGVQLFFLVSGYTLTLASSKKHRWAARDYKAFYIRRWFRIAPMYYLAIVGYFLIRLASAMRPSVAHGVKGLDIYSATSVLANVVFANGFLPSAQNAVVPGGWSIGAEFFFYLCFPFCLRRSRSTLVAGLIAIPVFFAILVHFFAPLDGGAINNSFVYFFPLVHLPCFLSGILLFRCIDVTGRRPFRLVLSISAAIAVLGTIYLWPLGLTGSPLFLLVPSLSILPFGWLLVFSSGHRLGESSILRVVGERSFSMYLNHFFFVDLFSLLIRQEPPHQSTVALGYLVVCILSYACASITFRYVEMPCVELGRRISRDISRGPPALRQAAG